jgi:4-amino-4-deoxy-L-arabinose transferase-like glycosyltransferase
VSREVVDAGPVAGDSTRASLGRWIAATFIVALIVRLLYLVVVVRLDAPILMEFDDGGYHNLAQSIASGDGMSRFGVPSAAKSPGYPWFLGACYALFGPNPAVPRVAQAILGALTAALLVALTWELGLGLAPAVLTGLIASFYPSAIYFVGRYFPMVLHSCLLIVAVHSLVRWGKRGTTRDLVISGVALAAAALVRSDALILVPLLAGTTFLLRGWRRQALVAAVVLVGCVAVLYSSWVIRNLLVLGTPVLTTSQASGTTWEGNNPWARGGNILQAEVLARYTDPKVIAALPPDQREQLEGLQEIRAATPGWTEVQLDSSYKVLTTKWRAQRPGAYWRNHLRKLAVFVSPWPGQGGPVLWRYRYVILACSGFVIFLGTVGFILARDRGPGRWVVLSVAIQALVTALIAFAHARYRFAAEMAFIPYAAFAATWLGSRLVRPRSR